MRVSPLTVISSVSFFNILVTSFPYDRHLLKNIYAYKKRALIGKATERQKCPDIDLSDRMLDLSVKIRRLGSPSSPLMILMHVIRTIDAAKVSKIPSILNNLGLLTGSQVPAASNRDTAVMAPSTAAPTAGRSTTYARATATPMLSTASTLCLETGRVH